MYHSKNKRKVCRSSRGSAIGYFIPDEWNTPGVAFSASQLGVMILLAKLRQENDVNLHVKAGEKVASNWKALSVGFLVLLGLFAIAVSLVLLLNPA